MKNVEFNPVGVCSKKIVVSCDENEVITKVQIIGGCPGNTLGVSKLCVGRKIDEIVELLDGVKCGMRTTSCPDQLAKALSKLKEMK